ncbi:hypothetical protein G9A89_000824 [Geosiphon pyriformis]|nr:hypothetical protein G9A89_000824 [Geosiphon pyriformis]
MNTSIKIKVDGLLLSTLIKLQAIAFALEYMSTSQSVDLFTNNQALLDMCNSINDVSGPDFHNKCWIEKKHIHQVISKKGLSITWNKVKDYSGVVGNKYANFYANATVTFRSFLPFVVFYRFFNVEGRLISRNAHYIAKILFNAVYSVGWETRCVGNVISADLCGYFNKAKTFCVWHPDNKIRFAYICTTLVMLWSYFMKILYHCLLVAKKKRCII